MTRPVRSGWLAYTPSASTATVTPAPLAVRDACTTCSLLSHHSDFGETPAKAGAATAATGADARAITVAARANTNRGRGDRGLRARRGRGSRSGTMSWPSVVPAADASAGRVR